MFELTLGPFTCTVNPELLAFPFRAGTTLVDLAWRRRLGTTTLTSGTRRTGSSIVLITIMRLDLIEPRPSRTHPLVVALTIRVTKLTIVVIKDHPTDVLHRMHIIVANGIVITTEKMPLTEVQLMLRGLPNQLEEHIGLALTGQRELKLGVQATPDPIPVLKTSTRVPVVTLDGLEIFKRQQGVTLEVIVIIRKDARIQLPALEHLLSLIHISEPTRPY